MSPLTTHVLDTSLGKPAKGVPVALKILAGGKWTSVAAGVTNADGRIPELMRGGSKLKRGVYRLTFETAKYFRSTGAKGFYPAVTITFLVQNPKEHYHVPLLLSPFGYSTYRGS